MKTPAPQPPPVFVSKRELAHDLRLTMHGIDRLIAEGLFPPPHSRPGPRHAVWLKRHYDAYVRDRKWPRDAFPRV